MYTWATYVQVKPAYTHQNQEEHGVQNVFQTMDRAGGGGWMGKQWVSHGSGSLSLALQVPPVQNLPILRPRHITTWERSQKTGNRVRKQGTRSENREPQSENREPSHNTGNQTFNLIHSQFSSYYSSTVQHY